MDTDAIVVRLGLKAPVNQDIRSLRRLFAAWCSAVPFDNLQKTRVLFGEPQSRLPGMDAEEFFESWLANGTGGTCWTHANAMFTLATALGFDARRATGSMFDFGPANHGTVIVRLPDDSHWLLDNVFLNSEPLRIDPEAHSIVDDGVHFAEVEDADGSLFVHGTMPPLPAIFFRLLERDVSIDLFAERNEASREKSAFNDRAHVMRCYQDRIDVLRGHHFYTLDRDGLAIELLDEQGVRARLATTMGISHGLVDEWASSGALISSLNAEEWNTEGLPLRTPPSRKNPTDA